MTQCCGLQNINAKQIHVYFLSVKSGIVFSKALYSKHVHKNDTWRVLKKRRLEEREKVMKFQEKSLSVGFYFVTCCINHTLANSNSSLLLSGEHRFCISRHETQHPTVIYPADHYTRTVSSLNTNITLLFKRYIQFQTFYVKPHSHSTFAIP